MTTSLVAFISSQSNPVCLLSLHWEKTTTIETIFLFWKKKISLCIHVMFKMRCVMYVLCTSPMYPLSTHNHNLYTFAQSTRCLYIHSYFMSRMVVVGFFFYTCACVRFLLCQQTMKQLTCIIKLIGCVFFRVRVHVCARVMSCEFFHSSSSWERINLREENGLNAFCPRGVVNLQWMSAALS